MRLEGGSSSVVVNSACVMSLFVSQEEDADLRGVCDSPGSLQKDTHPLVIGYLVRCI